MPLQETSGTASYDAFGGGIVAEPNYIESCFSTWLYTGNGGTPISYPSVTADPYSQSDGWFTRTGSVQTSAGYASNRQVVIRRNGVTVYDSNTTATTITVGSVTYTAQAYVGSTYGWAGDYANCFGVSSTDVTTTPITNGIDLAGNGGLVWIKQRNGGGISYSHILTDTNRGTSSQLSSNSSNNASGNSNAVTAFNSSGFSLGSYAPTNLNAGTFASWTFRKQPKFFDVVTGTQTVAGNVTINHNLGSVPGMIIVKSLSSANNWNVYHRSLGTSQYLTLETTDAASSAYAAWGGVAPTATQFTIGFQYPVGTTFVAYLFAHNAGGFGLTGTDNVISCGSFTTDASGNATVTLGYEPQLNIIKSTGTSDWYITDTMRGAAVGSNTSNTLSANSSAAEVTGRTTMKPNATGFSVELNASTTYIYIAIRRGPMKTPTSGASVFESVANSNSATANNTVGFPVDMQINAYRAGSYSRYVQDRLRGLSSSSSNLSSTYLFTDLTNAEATSNGFSYDFSNTTFKTGSTLGGASAVHWNFRRAPGFFDEVCYTGTGSATTVTHNLGVAPEFMMVKERNGTNSWVGYAASEGPTKGRGWNSSNAFIAVTGYWNDTAPTASAFTVGTAGSTNGSGQQFVAYLFASCPGVSKVTNFTGNGTTQTINCGFAAGARFVMIKATSTTGNWLVFDTARGMTTSTDPWLALNSTAAESATTGACTTTSVGFTVDESKLTGVNTNGVSYIVLAVA